MKRVYRAKGAHPKRAPSFAHASRAPEGQDELLVESLKAVAENLRQKLHTQNLRIKELERLLAEATA
jgi:hypothetical protein